MSRPACFRPQLVGLVPTRDALDFARHMIATIGATPALAASSMMRHDCMQRARAARETARTLGASGYWHSAHESRDDVRAYVRQARNHARCFRAIRNLHTYNVRHEK